MSPEVCTSVSRELSRGNGDPLQREENETKRNQQRKEVRGGGGVLWRPDGRWVRRRRRRGRRRRNRWGGGGVVFARTHACTHTRSCEIDLMYECVHARTHGFLLEKAPRVIPALKSWHHFSFFLVLSKVRLKCSALHFTLKGLYYIFYFLPFEGLSEALLSSGGVCWCFFVLCNPQWFIRVPARRSVCFFFFM